MVGGKRGKSWQMFLVWEDRCCLYIVFRDEKEFLGLVIVLLFIDLI